jgi:hypothetical protein
MDQARVTLFIDYQNTYRATRACFHNHDMDPAQFGQVDPVAIGETIVSRSVYPRQLTQVRVYRGLPSSHQDPKAYGAARRQISAWQRDWRVQVFSRPLRYPYQSAGVRVGDAKPREKGVDVSLAVDFVALAVQGDYDVGIIMSLDTDLVPALEFVAGYGRAHGGFPRAEVAAWSVEGHRRSRLSVPHDRLFCHWLTAEDYQGIRDWTVYV